MARLGSVAAAPFRGDQFASLYLGATRVQTVPGPPEVSAEWDDSNLRVFAPVPVDGGSLILQYRVYVDGVVFDTVSAPAGNPFMLELSESESQVGNSLRLSAINAIGEGPQSEPTTVEAVT